MTAKIKNSRYTLTGALIATFRRTCSQRGPVSIHAAIDCFAGLNMVH